jgi:WXG100 family type VII secretion target
MTIQFDSGQHDQLLHQLHAATSAIQDHLTDLENAVGEVEERWNGAARAAYSEAQTRWSAAMRSLHSVLKQADDAAAKAGEALSAAERAAVSLWG